MEVATSSDAAGHLRAVMRACRRVRWLAAAWAGAMFTLYAPASGVQLPFARVPAALTVIGVIVVINLASEWAERRAPSRLRQVATALLTVDAVVVAVLLWLFTFDNLYSPWAMMVLPAIEGAIILRLRGALWTWGALTVAYTGMQVWLVQAFGFPLEPRSILFRCGIVLIVAVATGSLATSLARARSELARQALADPLTGLANRTLFRDRLQHAWSRGSRDPGLVGVLSVDCDNFKAVNDRHGHDAGDAVLIEVAHRLRDGVRPGDTVARMGGDEFMVLLDPLSDANDAAVTAGRVVERLHALYADDAGTSPLSVSVGLAVGVPGDGRIEDLLAQADAALHAAKREGKDGWSRAPLPAKS